MNVLQDTILDQRLRAMLVTQETFQLKKYCGMVKKDQLLSPKFESVNASQIVVF